MNKTELIDQIADRTGVPKKDVGAVIDGLFVEVSKVVAKGDEKVTIPGFVTFEQVTRSARTGFNPQTGEQMPIPAGTAVKVTAGSKLKAFAKGTDSPPS
jgi:DNA-binding protein HU-beta